MCPPLEGDESLMTVESADGRPSLDRLFAPRSIAIVGARDDSPLSENSRGTLDSSADVYMVNPTRSHVFGRPTFPSLEAIGKPLDAVYCLLSAERAVDVAEEAARCDVGGLVLIAAGFAEAGSEGNTLQMRLCTAAKEGGFPVVGPNGAGFVSVPKHLDLTFLSPFRRRPGGASLVSHSGGLLEAAAASADRSGGMGFNLLISAGNEAVTDVADYVDYLVDDPDTTVILLAMELIRRPEAFFAAARRAREAGKPIIALKIARTERLAKMVMSHTGTLTSNPWVYEVGLRQANIQTATDVDDLVDRAHMFEQLPRNRWVPVKGIAVLAGSGGMASLGADVALEEGLPVPELPDLDEWIGTLIPGADVANPFDSRGLAADHVFRTAYEKFAACPDIDTAVFFGQFADWDERGATVRANQLVESSLLREKALVISPFAGLPGEWLARYSDLGAVIGNGPRGVSRGLSAMADFVRSDPSSFVLPARDAEPIEWGDWPTIASEVGTMLTFDATMRFLTSLGVPVAPYRVLEPDDPADAADLKPPFVVKLADVPHRFQVGAIRMKVSPDDLPDAVAELRALALAKDLPPQVVIQPQLQSSGEIFVGGQAHTELGPVTVLGLGGVAVEAVRRIGGRLAPFDGAIARSLVDEFTDTPLLDWIDGASPIRADLEELLIQIGLVAAGGRSWLNTLDINPLLVTREGLAAVDGLAVVSPPQS
jgi:acyl-CoA synthetase (NDP forming)